MNYQQNPDYLAWNLLALKGLNEIYMKNGGLKDLSDKGFSEKTEELIKKLKKPTKKGILEVRLFLAESFLGFSL